MKYQPSQNTVPAPEFPKGLEWLNTGHPLSLRELRGKIVLLDFWTFCCINCMHIIPDLKKLEEKFPEELVVIGVHSAKFRNERGTEQIRQAILRYGIKHPVVNDRDFKIWSQYGVHSWPTLTLIDPNGNLAASHSGEGAFDAFSNTIDQMIRYFDETGALSRTPLKLSPEALSLPDTPLSFPGKIHADPTTKRLFITDSNHNRIVIAREDGAILDIIGSTRQGREDGPFEAAQLNHPQGTFLEEDSLYIADTENHLIRVANLKTRDVKTILGTGEQARSFNVVGKGTQVALNSPWDLVVLNNKLYMAMAGSHQLWVADLNSLEIRPHAGSGREGRIDGPLLGAALAQPSGITTEGNRLYFADSETSSIRWADTDHHGNAGTIVGEDLFEFGDVDGSRPQARLEHPLGIAWKDGLLYVADTYNSKIKIIDPTRGTSTTYAGTGKHGLKDGSRARAEFSEPGGLAVLGDQIFVADTNNHNIRVIDLKTEMVSTLELKG